MMPIPVVDAAQAAQWDERARVTAKIPSRVLMESAGRGVAWVVGQALGPNPRLQRGVGVIVACGHGNNGGDGWVVARALKAAGIRVWAADAGGKRSTDCAANRALALASGVELLDPDEPWPEAGVVVDALLGTGATGAPRGAIGALAKRLAAQAAPVVAVDGPTGLDLSTGEAHGPVRADLTVTFGGARRGHLLARQWCGKLVVLDIGFPPADPTWPRLVTDALAVALLPGFAAAMHKGDRGRVLVIGGQVGMAGAALHAASAALEAGAGLAKLAAQEATVAAAQAALPDALTVTTALGPGLEGPLAEAVAWADALVIGPGIGRGPARTALVRAVLEATDKPVVLDADALHIGLEHLSHGRSARVLTPHAGEFRAAFPGPGKLLETDRFAAAQEAAGLLAGPGGAGGAGGAGGGAPNPRLKPGVGRAHAAVLLKGQPTLVAAAGGSTLVVAAGNPALATGGSGDLLAGFVGAFLARGLAPADAAALGAQVLGRAAEIAAAQLTVRSTRPADVLAALPELWRQWANLPPATPPVVLEIDAPALV